MQSIFGIGIGYIGWPRLMAAVNPILTFNTSLFKSVHIRTLLHTVTRVHLAPNPDLSSRADCICTCE